MLKDTPVNILLSMIGLVATAACGSGASPAAPMNDASSLSAFTAATANSAGIVGEQGKTKSSVCHRTEGTEPFILIAVAPSAVEAHVAHGDGLVGGPVPGTPGMQFDAACQPVTTRRTITVTGLWNGTSYLFFGLFTVTSAGPVDATATVAGFTGSMHLALLGFNNNICSTFNLPAPLANGPEMNAPTISAHWDTVPPGTYCLNVVPTATVPPPPPYSWTATITYP